MAGTLRATGGFAVRWYLGKKGKFGHEFTEHEIQGDGSLRFVKNTNGQGAPATRTNMPPVPELAVELFARRIIEESGVLDLCQEQVCTDFAGLHKKHDGWWQKIDIVLGDRSVSLKAPPTRHEPLALMSAALRTLHELISQLDGLAAQQLTANTAKRKNPFDEATPMGHAEPTQGACEQAPPQQPRRLASHVRSLASIPSMAIGASTGDTAAEATQAEASEVRSVATSDVSLRCTAHATQRLEERGITTKEVQGALKHGAHQALPGAGTSSAPTALVEHDGVVVCTDAETRKVAISAWRDDPAPS